MGNQDNNFSSAAGTLTQSYTRVITTPVASSTAASALSIIPISNQPNNTGTPNHPQNPYFYFSPYPNYGIRDGRSCLIPNQIHGSGSPNPGDGSGPPYPGGGPGDGPSYPTGRPGCNICA